MTLMYGKTYLHSYQKGRFKEVWAELLALGPHIRHEPLYSDACAVVQETMRRARNNIELIIERLNELEYRFAYPEEAWKPAEKEAQDKIAEYEQKYGILPLSFRMWFTMVGEVNLMGFHPSLSTYATHLGVSGHITYADPLAVQLNDPPWLKFFGDYYLSEGTEYDQEMDKGGPPYLLGFAPDLVHKSNYSGSGACNIVIPNLAIDALLIDDEGVYTGIPFVTYLRTSFKWGGFAGFEELDQPPTFAQKELSFLTEGLLPL